MIDVSSLLRLLKMFDSGSSDDKESPALRRVAGATWTPVLVNDVCGGVASAAP
jgi:hypothetical protein